MVVALVDGNRRVDGYVLCAYSIPTADPLTEWDSARMFKSFNLMPKAIGK